MTNRIQELELELSVVTGLHDKVDLINRLARELELVDPHRCLCLSQEAYQIANQDEPYYRGIGASLYNQARANRRLGNYAEALSQSLEALKYFEQLELLQEQMGVLQVIGSVYWFLGDYWRV